MTDDGTELAALECLNASLLASLVDKLSRIDDLQQANTRLLHRDTPAAKIDDGSLKCYIDRGCDEATSEGLKYLASKLVCLEHVADMLDIDDNDKEDFLIDSEKYVFLQSKNLMEKLKPAASNVAQKISETLSDIDVDTV